MWNFGDYLNGLGALLNFVFETDPPVEALKQFPMKPWSNYFVDNDLERRFRRVHFHQQLTTNCMTFCVTLIISAGTFFTPPVENFTAINTYYIAAGCMSLSTLTTLVVMFITLRYQSFACPTTISVMVSVCSFSLLSNENLGTFLLSFSVTSDMPDQASDFTKAHTTAEIVVTWGVLMCINCLFFHKLIAITTYFIICRLGLRWILHSEVISSDIEGLLQNAICLTSLYIQYRRDKRARASFALSTTAEDSSEDDKEAEHHWITSPLRWVVLSFNHVMHQTFDNPDDEQGFRRYFATVAQKEMRLICVVIAISTLVSQLTHLIMYPDIILGPAGLKGLPEAVSLILACCICFAITFMPAFGAHHPRRQQVALTILNAVWRLCTTSMVLITAKERETSLHEGPPRRAAIANSVYISMMQLLYNSAVAIFNADCLLARYGLVCAGIELACTIAIFILDPNQVNRSGLLLEHMIVVCGAGLVVVPQAERTRREYFAAVFLKRRLLTAPMKEAGDDACSKTTSGGGMLVNVRPIKRTVESFGDAKTRKDGDVEEMPSRIKDSKEFGTDKDEFV